MQNKIKNGTIPKDSPINKLNIVSTATKFSKQLTGSVSDFVIAFKLINSNTKKLFGLVTGEKTCK